MFIVDRNLLNAQDDKESESGFEKEILEAATENSQTDIDATFLAEQLEHFKTHPLDINSTNKDEFVKLGILNPFQIYSIIEYRKEHGPFLSVYELNGVDGISATTLKMLLPFITVKSDLSINQKQEVKNMLLMNSGRTIETEQGYLKVPDSLRTLHPNLYYPGNPYNVKFKYHFEKGNNLQAGIAGEKDPGETWFAGNNKTFDFTSGYMQFQNKGILKNLLIGDYSANFGQGLVLWSSFAVGKTSYSINVEKPPEGFKYYSSFNENQMFRGFASTIRLGKFDISAFISSKNIDANIVAKDSTGKVTLVSTLQNTGIHALPSEINDEKSLGEQIAGGNVTYDYGKFKIGGTFINVNYDAAIQKSDDLYNYYSFSGKYLMADGINYLFRGRKIEFFGEAARNSKNDNAFINGMIIQPVPELSLAIVYRNFGPRYFSPYSNAFAQNSNPSNEKGLYTGLEYIPSAKWKINAYTDFYKYPWLKYRISSPSGGSNYFIETTFEPSDKTTLSLRYNIKSQEQDSITQVSDPPQLIKENFQKTRFSSIYKISSTIGLKNRFEWLHYTKQYAPNQDGFLIYQDVNWKPSGKAFSIVLSYAVFQTGGWESRIYAYETDVLYSNSVPVFYGNGSRFYCVFRYQLLKYFDFWLRYGISVYSNKNIIGQGPTEIDGNRKSDIEGQIILNY